MIEFIFWLLVLPVTIAVISIYFMLHQYFYNCLDKLLKYFGF